LANIRLNYNIKDTLFFRNIKFILNLLTVSSSYHQILVLKYTDSEILHHLTRPDTKVKGYEMLIQTYSEKVYWQVRRMVNEHDDTNDIAQNIWLKVWNNIDKFKAESQISTWLYRIAYNETVDFITKRKKLSLADWDHEEEKISSKTDEVELDKEAIFIEIEKAIESLPDKQRAVFCMRYYDEMPYQQMSHITRTSEGALKASFHHALKKIEEKVKLALNQNE
jgi:RNA polymerase sigma factor (sigma-70 family)